MRFRLVPGIVLGIALGLAVGVGAYTFVYAQGYSYMTDNAEACVTRPHGRGYFLTGPSDLD
jgi:hypothetical protein